MTSAEIRRIFLRFFEERGHIVLPSSSLVPQGDPTLLLTSAGMVQIKPYFMGEAMPPSLRLASAQKCFRTTDIESVGNERNLTFFEMLGNFSVGDYFKRGAIAYAWELMTGPFGLPPERLWASTHPADEESLQLWQEVAGMPAERVVRLEENWWGPAGLTGPCGPDSELYLDRGEELGCGRDDCAPGCPCQRFLELWNLVFMQYYQDETGKRTLLPKQHIDTGLGLERMAMVMQGCSSVYETDLFAPIIRTAEELAGARYGETPRQDFSLRVIADHGRAVTFLIGDGVLPSNEGRGYILRRVLRRAVRHGLLLGLDQPFLTRVAEGVITLMGVWYTELRHRRDSILKVVDLEENRFRETLRVGLDLLDELVVETKARGSSVIAGGDAFRLYDTYGFPKELTAEVAAEKGLAVDMEGFAAAMERQREQARAAHKFVLAGRGEEQGYLLSLPAATEFVGYQQMETVSELVGILVDGQLDPEAEAGQTVELILRETPFYAEGGGQVGDTGTIEGEQGQAQVADTQRLASGVILHRGKMASGRLRVGEGVVARVDAPRRAEIARHHTATHLLHRALRQILGQHVQQSGSLVAPDRLRFDFSHFAPLTREELTTAERLVNEKVRANIPIQLELTTYEKATSAGAMALFGEKYGDRVRMVTLGEYSKELCGGTHVAMTGEIGYFAIVSEAGIGASLRRIEAVAGRAAEEYLARCRATLDRLAAQLGTPQVENRVAELLEELQQQRQEVASLQRALAAREVEELVSRVQEVDGLKVLAAEAHAPNVEVLREMGDRLRARLGPSVIVLGAVIEAKPSFVVMVGKGLEVHAGALAKRVAEVVGGGGGGRPDMAQAGGHDASKLEQALAMVADLVKDIRRR